MNRKNYIQSRQPVYNSSIPTSSYNNYKASYNEYRAADNYRYSAQRYPDKYQYKYQRPEYNDNQRLNPNVYKSNLGFDTKSSVSKLGSLNQRIISQTRNFQMRNHRNRYDQQRRSHSSELRRSRFSMEEKTSKNKYKTSNYQPFQYNSQHESMSSSRNSNQILNQPVISYDRIIKQPIFSSPEQLPSFKKTPTNQFVQFQAYNPTQPILKQNRNQFSKTNVIERSMFPEYNYQTDYSRQHVNYQRKNPKQRLNQSNQQFYELNTKAKQSFDSQRSNHSRQFYEQNQPVSPISQIQLLKKKTQRVQNQMIQTSFSNSPHFYKTNQKVNTPEKKNNFVTQVGNMVGKVDGQGKFLIPLVVGLGILLVLVQLIK